MGYGVRFVMFPHAHGDVTVHVIAKLCHLILSSTWNVVPRV